MQIKNILKADRIPQLWVICVVLIYGLLMAEFFNTLNNKMFYALEPALLYDHTEMREWRQLDILQYQCYVRCKILRIHNKAGNVKQIALGWSGKHDRHQNN